MHIETREELLARTEAEYHDALTSGDLMRQLKAARLVADIRYKQTGRHYFVSNLGAVLMDTKENRAGLTAPDDGIHYYTKRGR